MRGCIHWHDSGECLICSPFQLDPLCELRGEPYPRDGVEIDDFHEWEQTIWEQP